MRQWWKDRRIDWIVVVQCIKLVGFILFGIGEVTMLTLKKLPKFFSGCLLSIALYVVLLGSIIKRAVRLWFFQRRHQKKS